MKNQISDLTNNELFKKLRENFNENEILLQEITNREKDGKLKRKFDAVDEYIFRKNPPKGRRSA